jgi:hypothetical protein
VGVFGHCYLRIHSCCRVLLVSISCLTSSLQSCVFLYPVNVDMKTQLDDSRNHRRRHGLPSRRDTCEYGSRTIPQAMPSVPRSIRTKRGSGFIVAGVSGGACAPLLGAVADLHNSTAKAMSVPLAFFIAAWSYSLCVNFVPAYRDPADKFSTTKVELGGSTASVEDEESGHRSGVMEKVDEGVGSMFIQPLRSRVRFEEGGWF